LGEFFVATALESSRGGSAVSLTDLGVLREVIGASLYLTVVAVIGVALGALSPWTGFAALCGYAVVLTAVAAWRLRRRDA
jgi:hypothetical protein